MTTQSAFLLQHTTKLPWAITAVGTKLIAPYLQKSSRDCFFVDDEEKNVDRTVRKKGQEEARGNKAVAFTQLKGDIFTYTYEIGVVNMGEQMTLSIKI